MRDSHQLAAAGDQGQRIEHPQLHLAVTAELRRLGVVLADIWERWLDNRVIRLEHVLRQAVGRELRAVVGLILIAPVGADDQVVGVAAAAEPAEVRDAARREHHARGAEKVAADHRQQHAADGSHHRRQRTGGVGQKLRLHREHHGRLQRSTARLNTKLRGAPTTR